MGFVLCGHGVFDMSWLSESLICGLVFMGLKSIALHCTDGEKPHCGRLEHQPLAVCNMMIMGKLTSKAQ